MKEREEQTEHTLYLLGWIFIALFTIGLLVVRCFPEAVRYITLPCIFNKLTGYYCPGCGGTRAVKFFLTGHWIKSVIYHPVVPYIGIVGGTYMITHTISNIMGGRIKGIQFRIGYVYAMAGIIAIQFVIKNLMIYFFDFYII